MAVFSAEVREIGEKVKPWSFATADKNGKPNVVKIGSRRFRSEDTIIVMDNHLNKTKKNILEKYNSTGVQDVLDAAVYRLLRYIAIFPGGVNKLEDKDGNVLPDCFLLPEGSTALDFAFRIHTDIGNKFIRAIDVKTKMVVGKDHPLKHRDVIEIVTSK